MKYTNSFKIGLIAVTALVCCTGIVHARSVNASGAYQQMGGILRAIKAEANNPNTNMSNTYSGKLLNNVEGLQKDAKTAAAIAPGGGQTSSGAVSVLIRLAAAAADAGAIGDFSADAKNKIVAELDGALTRLTDPEDVDDANVVLDALGAPPRKWTTSAATRRTPRLRGSDAYRDTYAGTQYMPAAAPTALSKRLAYLDTLRNTSF